MCYESVDKLQNALGNTIFSHTKDRKKAAGRALGTLVEIVTFYLLKSWGFYDHLTIERGLEEYGNPDIKHNVEYSLHPLLKRIVVRLPKSVKNINSKNVLKAIENQKIIDLTGYEEKKNQLFRGDGVIRNACNIANSRLSSLYMSYEGEDDESYSILIYEQHLSPFAIFECKRVGVEEGMSKGPQTIEKAKQGAYVARTSSSLQKIRNNDGDMYGIIYREDGNYIVEPYINLMEKIIYSDDVELLRRFILTIGIVSNHGNWFTAENQNKEMKVLAQSYDWLLFLTDGGLSEFIGKFLLSDEKEFEIVKRAFDASYASDKKFNQFTKVQMNIDADKILTEHFKNNLAEIEGWFNVISPNKSLKELKSELEELTTKNWIEILL